MAEPIRDPTYAGCYALSRQQPRGMVLQFKTPEPCLSLFDLLRDLLNLDGPFLFRGDRFPPPTPTQAKIV
jgi:hypothetical protein